MKPHVFWPTMRYKILISRKVSGGSLLSHEIHTLDFVFAYVYEGRWVYHVACEVVDHLCLKGNLTQLPERL